MSKKEIRKSQKCGNCGHVTYQGYYKYTCDGCHGSMTKKEVEATRLLDFNVHFNEPDSETGGEIKDLQFHGVNCMLEYVENLTEEELQKHTCWNIWAHNGESIKVLREILLKAKEDM